MWPLSSVLAESHAGSYEYIVPTLILQFQSLSRTLQPLYSDLYPLSSDRSGAQQPLNRADTKRTNVWILCILCTCRRTTSASPGSLFWPPPAAISTHQPHTRLDEFWPKVCSVLRYCQSSPSHVREGCSSGFLELLHAHVMLPKAAAFLFFLPSSTHWSGRILL